MIAPPFSAFRATSRPFAGTKTYPGYPHGMATTHADVINKDILAFIRGEDFGADRQEEERLIVEPIPAPVE